MPEKIGRTHLEAFTEYSRLRWFAREMADGPFSYLWYDTRQTTDGAEFKAQYSWAPTLYPLVAL